MTLKTFRTRTLAVAAVTALTITGTALAARPNASKKYGGATSAKKFNGFRSQVTFKVSKDAKQLQNFTYQSVGCFTGFGGLKTGVNYLKQSFNEHKLGTIPVASGGSFSRKNVVTTFASAAQTTTTKSTVSGHFKNAKTAVGTITFTQSISGKSAPVVKPCSGKVTFTATQAKPSSGGGITGGY
jgi:hypothetical protein